MNQLVISAVEAFREEGHQERRTDIAANYAANRHGAAGSCRSDEAQPRTGRIALAGD